jgi:hypothetical protein
MRKQRSPAQILKLYNRLWRRAAHGKCPPFLRLKPNTLTGRCIKLLIPYMLPIQEVLKSSAYRKAVRDVIRSN